MIVITVNYPGGDDVTFDFDYYLNKHIAAVQEVAGDTLRSVRVDRGVSGGPGVPAPFVAVAHLVFDSLDAYKTVAGPLGKRLADDVPNYTNTKPLVQVSEILIPAAS